jgi:hypothetical protein
MLAALFVGGVPGSIVLLQLFFKVFFILKYIKIIFNIITSKHENIKKN